MNTAPVFIKIEDYKEVLDVIDVIKAKINKSKALLEQVNEIKAEEDEQLIEWKTILDNISDKIYFIDKTLFDPSI